MATAASACTPAPRTPGRVSSKRRRRGHAARVWCVLPTADETSFEADGLRMRARWMGWRAWERSGLSGEGWQARRVGSFALAVRLEAAVGGEVASRPQPSTRLRCRLMVEDHAVMRFLLRGRGGEVLAVAEVDVEWMTRDEWSRRACAADVYPWPIGEFVAAFRADW